MSDRPPVDPRYDPRFQRGFDAPRQEVWRAEDEDSAPAGLIEVPRFGPPPEERPIPDAATPEETDEPRNPWLLTLTIVSSVLLAAGAIVAYRLGVISRSPFTEDFLSMLLNQSLYQFTTPLITAGLVGLLVRIAFGALRSRR